MQDVSKTFIPAARSTGMKEKIWTDLLGGFIPRVQALLYLLASLLRRHRLIHHSRAHAPQFVLQVRRAPIEDLIGVANRGFAILPPAEELVGKRVIQGHFGTAQRE